MKLSRKLTRIIHSRCSLLTRVAHCSLALLTFMIMAWPAYAQPVRHYRMDWWDSVHHVPIEQIAIQHHILIVRGFNSIASTPTYDGLTLKPLDSVHCPPNVNGNHFYPFSLLIDPNTGHGDTILAGEKQPLEPYGSNADSLITVQMANMGGYRDSFWNGPYERYFTIYTQSRDNKGHHKEKYIKAAVYPFADTEYDGGMAIFHVPFNDLHHCYCLLVYFNNRGHHSDSMTIAGKTLIFPHSLNIKNILCCFNYNGTLAWAHNIFDAQYCDWAHDYGNFNPGNLLYYITPTGDGYLHGNVMSFSGYCRNEFISVSGTENNTLLIHFSKKGEILRQRFFGTACAVYLMAARYPGKFYFLTPLTFHHGEYNNYGLHFHVDDSAHPSVQYVYGEMDSNFKVLWYKTIISLHDRAPQTDSYGNYFSLSTNGFINDLGEYMCIGYRYGPVYQYTDTGGKQILFDSTGNQSQILLYKLSQNKPPEIVDTLAYGIIPPDIKFYSYNTLIGGQMCADSNGAIYVHFIMGALLLLPKYPYILVIAFFLAAARPMFS